jgi:hypothetical protein
MSYSVPWARGTPEAEAFKRDLKRMQAWELRENIKAMRQRVRSSGSDPDEGAMRREFDLKLELIYDDMDRRGYDYDL